MLNEHAGHSCLRSPAILLACLAFVGIPAYAQDELGALEERAFRAAVDRVAPSVVRIETIGGQDRVDKVPFGTGPTTGLVVGADGRILTSAFNFLNQPSSILVQLADGTRKAARRVATDYTRMIVLLRIDVDGPLPVPQFAPKQEIRVGQWSLAVGRSFESSRPGVAVGIVSALDRIWGKAIQTDAAVSPNNYGGPLVDVRGRVLGLIVPMSPGPNDQMAGLEWYDSGIGFAITGEELPRILARLEKGEDLRPGVIGISFANPNAPTAEPIIVAVRPNSPAREAGIESGDRIVQIDEAKIARAADVMRELSQRYAGDSIRLAVQRGDRRVECETKLVAKLVPYEHPFLGVLPMRSAAAKSSDAAGGVTVRYVFPDGPAAKAGIEPGDLIVKLGGKPVEDRKQIRRAICDFKPDQEVQMEIRRGEEDRKVSVILARLPEEVPTAEIPKPFANRPTDGEPGAAVGTFEIGVPEFKNRAVVYVPDGYRAGVPHGVVIWIHGPGRFDRDGLIARWKPHCDRHDLILLAPRAADADKWKPSEVEVVAKLLERVRSTYSVDRSRTVALGRRRGGAMAFLTAFTNRELIGGVASIDSPLASKPPENEPVERLAFYFVKTKQGPFADRIAASVEHLRKIKYPVTVRELDAETDKLSAEELTRLVRWIDALDRI